MMSTVHSAVYVEVKKRYSDEKILKPLVVYDYTQMMKGVDKNDQFNTYYNPFISCLFVWQMRTYCTQISGQGEVN